MLDAGAKPRAFATGWLTQIAVEERGRRTIAALAATLCSLLAQGLAGQYVPTLGASGAVAGALLQRTLGNPSVYGVSPVGGLGLLTMLAGLAAPLGLPGRAALVAGGATYLAGAQLYSHLFPKEPAP